MRKVDVLTFAQTAEKDLLALHYLLSSGSYQHGKYSAFFVCDPKPRSIHKASVLDRVLHHAIVRILYPIFNKAFIFDSYSSRKDKGTHKAGQRFREFLWKLSRNNTKTVWVLKCDIKKFFGSVDHDILLLLIQKKLKDDKALKLLGGIIDSFHTKDGKGIPLGNLTSQLFSNIYLDAFDQFVKRILRVKHYIRYADDFVILDRDKDFLLELTPKIADFLDEKLKLMLHPNKIFLKKWHEGIDFLGYVHFPYHSILRTKTKRRIIRKIHNAKGMLTEKEISAFQYDQILQSYLGRIRHSRGKGLKAQIL